jgi:hypothetical protein
VWEQQLQEDFELQRSALRDQQQQRLWLLRKQMEDQESLLTEQLTAGQESRVTALQMQVQVGLGARVEGHCTANAGAGGSGGKS